MARIIGITGLAGAGKDTAARAMQREIVDHGGECRIGSFAAPIREISKHVGLDPYDRTLKERRRTFRLDDFSEAFQEGIEAVLGERLSEEHRAELHTFTIDALEKFVYRECCGFGERMGCRFDPPECCAHPNAFIGLSPREFMQVLGTEGGQSVRRTLWVDLAKSLWDCLPGVVLVPDTRFAHELAVLDELVLVVRPGTVPVNGHISEKLAHDLTCGAVPDRFRDRMFRLYNNSAQPFFERTAAKLACCCFTP